MTVNQKNQKYFLIIVITSIILIGSLSNDVVISKSNLALSIDGRYIVDQNNDVVVLKGFQKHGFEDNPEGSWKTLDKNYFNIFNEDAVKENLQEIKSWGANEIRVIDRTQFWVENTVGGSGKAHRDVIKRLIELSKDEGIYVNYCLFAMDSASGFHQVPWGTNLIPSRQDFVDLWVSIATELSVYDNVMFELWNEVAYNQDEWFNGCQEAISGIRQVCDNVIIVQWNWDVWYKETDTGSYSGKLDWVADSRIQGENILYSTHMYHESRGFYQAEDSVERTYFVEQSDIERAFIAEQVDYVLNTLEKPLYIGEFGPRHVDLPYPPSELIACDNALNILDNWGISYSCMWWWIGGGGITGLYSNAIDGNGCDWNNPTEWGVIVDNHV